MSIRINVGAEFDAKDIRAARRELDALETQAQGLQGAMMRLGRSATNFGVGMARVGAALTSSVTLPIIGVATASAKMAADFQESMSRITGLVGIAADEVKAMEASVLDLSGQTAKAPQELAEGLFVVTSAGLRGAEAMEALEFAAKAGAAGLGATNDIARAVAGAMNAYGSETLDAARATDIIVATARAGNFATDQFAGALGRVLPFAQQAQASLEDVGGAVALLTRTNGNAAESITQVQALFRAFVVPTEEAKKILDEAGTSAAELRDIMGRRGLVEALRALDRAVGGNREVLGRLLSSTEAASAAFQILNSDATTLQDTFGVVTNSVGMTDDAFGVVAEQSAFKFRQALNELTLVGIELGAELLPVITDIIDRFSQLIDRFNQMTPAQRDLVKQIALFAAVVPPAIAAIGGFIAIIGAATVALGAMSAAMVIATGGLVLVGAALAGIAWSQFNRDVGDFTTNLREQEKSMRDAAIRTSEHAREYYRLADAQAAAASTARLNGLAAEFAESGFSALSREQRAARRETEEMVDPLAEVTEALDALGQEANGGTETPGGGGTGAKIVALSRSMRDFFQQLNETNVGVSDAGDMIAQFSREVLAAGNITDQTARGAENLARAIKQNLDTALAEANQRLDEAVSKFNTYRDAIVGGIRSGNTIADAVRNQTAAQEALTRAQEEYERAKAGDDPEQLERAADALKEAERNERTFLEFLQTGVTTAEGFAAQIDAVREAGASLEVVRQIAELGAQTGGRIAAELLAGGAAAIEQANAMVTAVENASRRAGESAAQQFFGAGVAAARAMVRGIEETIPELQSVLDRIAEAIERALGTRPNVDISGRQGPFIAPTPAPSGGTGTGRVRYDPRVLTGSQAEAIAAIPMSAFKNFTVPGLAAGGLVTGPTFAMVGEAGPELVLPLDRLGSMGGQTTVNVTVTSADPEAVVEAIRRYTRGNGPLGQVVSL